MIRPLLQDDAFLADVSRASANPNEADFDLWWLGQSGFLLHWQGEFALLDPYLSDSLTKKYAATDKPHARMTERVVAPERLDFVALVSSSHSHTDHLDPETLQPLARVNPGLRVVCPEACRFVVRERSGLSEESVHGLDVGPSSASSVQIGLFQFHAVPAAHESVDLDSKGRHVFLGYVIRFGPWAVYHSGDTVRYPGMEELLRGFRVDLALLPINGRGPERRVAGNLWGREAAVLAHDIGARMVIPCHYDMFAFNTASPDEFVLHCHELHQPFAVLRAGERWSSSALRV